MKRTHLIKHYKNFFGNTVMGEGDNRIIDWAMDLMATPYNKIVEPVICACGNTDYSGTGQCRACFNKQHGLTNL